MGIMSSHLSPQFKYSVYDISHIHLDQMYTRQVVKFMQDMEALENKNTSYDSIFRGIHKQHTGP